MYLFPNGQNIQILPASPRTNTPTNAVSIEPAPPAPKQEGTIISYLKDVAPHLNRAQRRAKASELKHRAKEQAGELARKEIAKQNKEKTRG